MFEKQSQEQIPLVSGWIRLINAELESGSDVTSIVAQQGTIAGPYATVDSLSRANSPRAGQRANIDDEDDREDRVRQLAKERGYLLGSLSGVGPEGAFDWLVFDLLCADFIGSGPNTARTLADVEEYLYASSGE